GVMCDSNFENSLSEQLLISIQPQLNSVLESTPSKYVDFIWKKAELDPRLTRDVRGKFFELLIATCLIRNKILPFFWQAQLEFVPLANFDLVVYTEERGPIVLSLKTSIRERYKQAEFEAQAMKDVHRRAKNFLVTMEREEALSLQSKIDTGVLDGIDEAIVANENSFDRLIEFLKSLTIVDSPIFSAIKNPKKIDLIG
ncbi:MAG: hypothetical protein ACO3YX_06160, partial [Candidatus Nanopelagicaceae bacterium]